MLHTTTVKRYLRHALIRAGLEGVSLARAGRLWCGAGGRGIIFTLHHVRPTTLCPSTRTVGLGRAATSVRRGRTVCLGEVLVLACEAGAAARRGVPQGWRVSVGTPPFAGDSSVFRSPAPVFR